MFIPSNFVVSMNPLIIKKFTQYKENHNEVMICHVVAHVFMISGFFLVSQSLEASHQMLSENIALAIILPIILVILLIGGIYMYYTK